MSVLACLWLGVLVCACVCIAARPNSNKSFSREHILRVCVEHIPYSMCACAPPCFPPCYWIQTSPPLPPSHTHLLYMLTVGSKLPLETSRSSAPSPAKSACVCVCVCVCMCVCVCVLCVCVLCVCLGGGALMHAQGWNMHTAVCVHTYVYMHTSK